MKLKPYLLLVSILIVSILSSCRGDKPKRMPDTLPDVHGYISSIKTATQNQDQYKAIIMVKAIEGINTKYKEASIQVDKKTLIESKTGKHLKFEQLREGHEIEAWFDGEIMESYPVQGYVKAIRVDL
jgi:hypothetical protein